MQYDDTYGKCTTLSLVVPVYDNRSDQIERLVDALPTLASSAEECGCRLIEAVIVDDGSPSPLKLPDRTKFPFDVSIHRYGKNRGKGFAVKTGMHVATGDLVLMCDCDMSTPFTELPKLVPSMRDGAWIACGSRKDLDRAKRNVPMLRYVLSHMFRMCAWLAGSRGILDTQCGFKLFQHAKMLPVFDMLSIYRFAFDVEVIAEAKKNGGMVSEVPVEWHGDKRSTLRVFNDGPMMLLDMIMYSLGLLRIYRRLMA